MAVGATPRNVLALVFQQGFMAVAVGLAIGLGAALAAMRSLRSFLPGLESNPAHLWIARRFGGADRGNCMLDPRAPRHQDRPDVRPPARIETQE